MRFPAVISALSICAALYGCGTVGDTTKTVTLSDLPERVLLKPGECTSTLSADRRRLGWICAEGQSTSDVNVGFLKGELSAVEQSHDQLLAEKVWLEQLLTSTQKHNQLLSEKLVAVTREENDKISQLRSQIGLLNERVAVLAAEKETILSGDEDLDGVVDLEDLCATTRQGLLVDKTGCARDQEIVPQGINFAWNSSALTPDSHPVLDAVAMQLKRHPELSFEVAGHTDNTGNAASNLDISTKRASTVRDYLVMRGIPASLLSVRGYGNEKPIADNSTAQGRAINRRVSLYRPSQEVEVTVRR